MTRTAFAGVCAAWALGAAALTVGAGSAFAADAPVSAPAPASTGTTAPAATPASTPATTAPAGTASTASTTDAGADPIVCRRDAPLGSRLAAKKQCLKRSEWALRAREARDNVDRVQRNATSAGPDKNMGGG
jgi:hypothetical protein